MVPHGKKVDEQHLRVVFRTDASLEIGTGHVMRCLTLAEALRERGASCRFVCRSHPGNLIELIRQRGFAVHALPFDPSSKAGETGPAHAAWLGADWQTDAEQTKAGVSETAIDWLIVDHYALDARWENALAEHCGQVMVIDDLADRPHACKLLLDQTFGRDAKDYRPLVPEDCTLLCGSSYALLRPEFAALRPYSLQRRLQPQLKHLLITLGGIDKDNVTEHVLHALRACPLPADCKITVVMGATAPWLSAVQQQAQIMPWPTTVRVGVNNMAQLMADSDLAIGAGGATSWERCCLGLPSILAVLAANQTTIASALTNAGAVVQLETSDLLHLLAHMPAMRGNQTALSSMSHAASQICKGEGAILVTSHIMKVHNEDHIACQ